MAFTKSTLELPLRDEALTDDEHGAGLYPDETLIELDTGELVAVSVTSKRQANTGGLMVCAWSRAVNPDGSTLLDSGGEEIENEHHTTFTPHDVLEYGIDYLNRQVLLLMIGEPLDAPVDENGISTGPLKVSSDVVANASIKNDLSVAQQATESEAIGANVLFP